MNKLGEMVRQYNLFVDDLGNLNNDMYELLTKEFKLEHVAEYWSPRDRSAWSKKQRFCSWYKNNKQLLFLGIDLIEDIPYLQLLRCNVNLKNTTFEEFSENDCFGHTENTDIEKIEEPDYFYSFEQDWGKCCFCRIDLTSITSNEVINDDVKKIIRILLNSDFYDTKFNNVILVQN